MARVRSFATGEATASDLRRIRELMDTAFEGEFTEEDWTHTIGGLHVVVEDAENLMAHASVIQRTIEIAGRPFRTGYAEGVATAPDQQGRGFGSMAMREIGSVIRSRYEMGALATDRQPFYERLGWERWRGTTFVRTASGLRRTPGDDDAVMVLRFGPSEHVDLSESISCQERPGDHW